MGKTRRQTRRYNKKRASQKHLKRSKAKHSGRKAARRTQRRHRLYYRGGTVNNIDSSFVNDALPYGEYRTAKGIRSGFQIRK